MAFSKIAGFDVAPRSDSSSIMRCSSPPSMSERRTRSSQGLVPAATRAASRGLTLTAGVLIGSGAPLEVQGELLGGQEDRPAHAGVVAVAREADAGLRPDAGKRQAPVDLLGRRSEERRVGKECRSRWS